MVLPYDNMDYGEDEVGARNITELTDVELTNLANGEILKYNSSNNKWENQADNAGGGSLDNLTDTNITSVSNNQILKYNSTSSKWENTTLTDNDTDNLVDLTDTNISSVANNEILKYNSTSQLWENNNLNLNEINDVNITSLQNGEVLKYNSTSGKWENQDNTDTLNELTDVTLTGSNNNQVLKYNGTIWVNNYVNLTELADTNIPALNNGDILRYNSVSQKWETDTFNINDLDDVNITSLTDGDLIKYDGTNSNFINFAPTYLDGAGISDNFLIKVVGGATTQTSITETNTANSTNITFNNGSIETEIFDTTKKRMHLTTDGIATNGITITSDGRVGIGIVEPEEDLEVDGSIQIDSANVARLKFQQSGQTPHALCEIDGEQDGTNGGDLQFYTKVDGGTVTEKLRINNVGAIGIGGNVYGNSGQVLVSNGSGSSVSWANQTDTTYSAGTGMSLAGTTFSIGQAVGTSNSPSFKQLSLGATGTNEGILNLQDFTNTGTQTVAQIKGILDGTNGGKLQFFTKVDGGSLTERLSISPTGFVKITTDAVGLGITSADGVTEQGYIYNSLSGTKDFVIDSSVGSSTKGITFRTNGGNDRMRITDTGNVGIGTLNPNYKLEVDGTFYCDNITVPGTVANPIFRAETMHPSLQGSRIQNIRWLQLRNVGGVDDTELQTNRVKTSLLITDTISPGYTTLPSFTGRIGQIVSAPTTIVVLVVNNLIQVRSITIPYTGVWALDMALYLGNAGALTGDIKYPTSIKINGNTTQNFYGTNITGVNGSIKRNLNANDVITFHTYLTGANASTMTVSQRTVWTTYYTFLTATRIA